MASASADASIFDELDEYVSAFERAYQESGSASIEAFLPPAGHRLYAPVLRELVRVDLEYAWARGTPQAVAHYQARFPALTQDEEALKLIAFEEDRLRRLTIDAMSRAAEHTSNGREHAGHQAAGQPAPSAAEWPEVGQTVLGFRLIGELGRGAFGRVYLAHQGDLADRLVALKVSTRFWAESQTLARLQHTNIVPIYSVHRIGPFQAVCMPYVGSATLRSVIRDVHRHSKMPVAGTDLLSTLRLPESNSADQEPEGQVAPTDANHSGSRPNEATLRFLSHLTYPEAVLWLIARLADGLAHAHERGILHRDLKPANVLLTDDGQPMLLDFNLSDDCAQNLGPANSVGGTLPYMAPEQLEALRGGNAILDARSDIYSLGVIAFELLTGRRPYPMPVGPADMVLDVMLADRTNGLPDVRPGSPEITPAMTSIVRHCLASRPDRRYQSALELREDIERQLAHLPLKHTPEPSLAERARKWTRRHPTLCSATSVGVMGAVLVASLGAIVWVRTDELRAASARLHRDSFRSLFEECQLLLNTNGGPSEHFDRGLALARQARHEYGVDGPGPWRPGPLILRLPLQEQQVLRGEMAELVLLETRARVALASRGALDGLRRGALENAILWLDWAERTDPHPPAALYEERARYHTALRHAAEALHDRLRVAQLPPSSARDYYLLGTSQLARGHVDRAEALLSQAVAHDTRQFWAWFALGICHSDQGRHAEAALDFSLCTVLAPRFAWPYLNRGLSLARAGRLSEARAAYDRALKLNRNFTEALVDRALVCLELGEPLQALSDLERALALGPHTPSLEAARAEALVRLGRTKEAEDLFAESIRLNPRNPVAYVARGFSRIHRDPSRAETDFVRALELDSRNARAMLGRAYLLRRQDPRAALAEVDEALAADSHLEDAIELRALLRARLGEPGAEDDVDRLVRVPTPRRLYNAACALAIRSRTSPDPALVPKAIELIRRALEAGMPDAGLASDPDLEPLRGTEQFARMLHHGRS